MTGRQLHASEDTRVVDAISAELVAHGAVRRPAVRLKRKDGSLFWSELQSRTYRARDRKEYVTVLRAHPTHCENEAPSNPSAPCLDVIREAEQQNGAAGHENGGFLSMARGFLPMRAPLERLSRPFAAWDQVAAELPALYRDLSLRRRVDELPLLDARESSLPDDELLRACALLAIIAQAYWNVEVRPPERLPLAVTQPWAELRRRLSRGSEVLSYIDLIIYNWRVVDPNRPRPLEVENLRLLLPTVDNAEERVFYLTQLEILDRCGPIVGFIAAAQSAVLGEDAAALERALGGIARALSDVVRTALPKINPNQFGRTFVDPVVWAKTVAPFAVPMRAGDQGPSGTSSPIFNTLDLFFGRKDFRSFLGREIEQLRASYPPHWRAFLRAVSAVSVGEFIAQSGSATLRGAWRDAFELYVGADGFLGRHRMKVYGYLELAFKVGRAITIGGFGGVFKDRTWDEVDSELEASRGERLSIAPSGCPVALAQRRTDAAAAPDGMLQLTLDVSRSGVRPVPGDRCSIYPENAPLLVERTLSALGARGDEAIGLTDEWKAAATVRGELAGKTSLPLRRLLELGCIRPVTPRVAEALHARTQNASLLDHIRRGATERWELWELIELLRRDGYTPEALWREPGNVASERLCQIIPPERARVYSVAAIASLEPGASEAGQAPVGERAASIDLMVGPLTYATSDGAPGASSRREGTASSFLMRAARERSGVPFRLEHAARFQAPSDPRTPIVFFAGGTGVAAFSSFLQHRVGAGASGQCWLLWSLRTRRDLAVSQDFAPALRARQLDLDVCFTREGAEIEVDADGRLHTRDGSSRRIIDLILEPAAVARLQRLLEPCEGPGAILYVCGRGGFAQSVLGALEAALARIESGSEAERRALARARLHRLVADQRLFFEVHTDGQPQTQAPRLIDRSEIAEHNDERAGYWLIINRAVYDLTAFVDLHPGGQRVVQAYAGMDATHGYARAHHQRPEVDAMREIYRIGMLRSLDLDETTVEILGPAGPVTVNCRTAHRAWVHALELVVEMQNALFMDYSLQQCATTSDETPSQPSAYRLSRGLETHWRFMESYLRVLEADTLPGLWRITQGLFAPDQSPEWMSTALVTLRASDAARSVERAARALVEQLTPAAAMRSRALVELLRGADLALLAGLKRELSRGVRVFERHERRARTCGAAELREVSAALLAVLQRATSRLAAELGPHASVARRDHEPAASNRTPSLVPSRLYTSRHWLFEQQPDQRIAVLQRSPEGWTSLAELRQENEAVLSLLRADQRRCGLLVDMRQAPIRNDPAFEDSMAELRQRLTAHFERTAILLESTLGELQVTRLERDERRTNTITTRSESTAYKFLSGGK